MRACDEGSSECESDEERARSFSLSLFETHRFVTQRILVKGRRIKRGEVGELKEEKFVP